MPLTRRARTSLLALLTLPLLVRPALVNRYPLLFPHTLDYIADVQNITVLVSLLAIFALLPQSARRRDSRLLGFTTILFTAILLNAVVTGVLSGIDTRYQARIVWLIPFPRLSASARPRASPSSFRPVE